MQEDDAYLVVLAGNFKVEGFNGRKKTPAFRQRMAKENREAEHVLGRDDPRQTNKQKQNKKSQVKQHLKSA